MQLQDIEQNEVYKQVISESYGGVIYNVANRTKYDTKELLEMWDSLTPAERENANGITTGAMNFLQEN